MTIRGAEPLLGNTSEGKPHPPLLAGDLAPSILSEIAARRDSAPMRARILRISPIVITQSASS
jgi:hypothetical protein